MNKILAVSLLCAFSLHAQTVGFGSLVRYNDQYNGSNGLPNNGRYTFGDTPVLTTDDTGTTYVTFNDGYGPAVSPSSPTCNGTTGENLMLANFSGSGYLNAVVTNCMPGYCAFATTNCPSPWADGDTWKSAGLNYVKDSSCNGCFYMWVYRQQPSTPFGGNGAYLICSSDHGATWRNPNHSTGLCAGTANSNGDPPAPSDTPTMTGTKMVRPRFVQYEQPSTGSINVDGNPTYHYVYIEDSGLTNFYLARCARSTDCTQSTNWSYYVGAVGGSPTTSGNWSSSTTSATVMYTISGTTVQAAPKYFSACTCYLWAVTGITAAYDLSILTSTQVTGGWTNLGTVTGSNSIRPNFPELDLHSASFSGQTLTVYELTTGDYTVQTSNPATNNYSLFYRSLTVTFSAALSGGFGLAGGSLLVH